MLRSSLAFEARLPAAGGAVASFFAAAGLVGALAFAPSVARADDGDAKGDAKKSDAKSEIAAKSESGDPAKSGDAAKNGDAAKSGDDDNAAVVHRYPPTGVRWALIVGGSTLTLGAYAGTLAAGLGWPDVPGADKLAIPFAGPWMALAENACGAQNPDCGALLYVRGALEIASGIVQVAGLPLIGEGIFMTTEKAPPPTKQSALMPATMSIAPIVTPTTAGVGLMGTF